MNSRKLFFCFLSFIFFEGPSVCDSQNKWLDSMNAFIRSSSPDTNRVKALNSVSDQLWREGDYDKALARAKEAEELSEKLGYRSGRAEGEKNIGIVYWNISDYPKALEHYFKALKILERSTDIADISTLYVCIGIVYDDQGDYSNALENYFKALALKEKINDKDGMSSAYSNIGLVYSAQKSNDKALGYHLKALKLQEELGVKQGIAASLNNIGLIYNDKKDYSKALLYYSRALKINRETGNANWEANNLSNIGNVCFSLKDYAKALDYFQRGLKISEELNNKSDIALTLEGIGSTYQAQGNINAALESNTKALAIAREINSIDLVKSAEENLTGIFHQLHDDAKELAHYKGFIAARDSLSNAENTERAVRAEMNFDFTKKQAAEKADQEKKDAVLSEERQKQSIILLSVIIGFLIVLGFAVVLFNRFKIIKKQKSLIMEQNSELQQKKEIIEEKQKEMVDSIYYARRIQRALLTSENYIRNHLSDFFVFYQPKDIVSGDFYWARKVGTKFIFTVADCTGHGVPGAFMSMLGINSLNKYIIENEILQPELILNKIREEIITVLNPEGSEEESKDGMDCVLCAYDIETKQLQYAAANNSFYIIRNNSLMVQQADKMPVGKFHDEENIPFNLRNVQLQKGDLLYIFTDGFADQFGGPKGKKFKYKQLEALLIANAGLGMNEQKNILEETINSWKNGYEQVDDILVMGIKI
jgi:serine phosphatase RsbU (regulator of sigma subunit)/Tfp pilus assembly protein PilF